jgi:predicted ATPase/class 3 adenylate cyclase
MDADRSTGVSSVTLLFTDIEGSTELWVSHPDSAGRAVGAHDAIVAEAIGAKGGRIIKTTGDGFLAAFPMPRAGVEAAIQAQVGLAGHSGELMHAAHVRMALHTGSVEERSGDLFGLAVHKTERIMSAASAGQVLVSNSTAAVVRDDLPPGAHLIDLGDQRLRGIPGVERVFQLAHPSLRSGFPALPTTVDALSNLPPELTTFVGREREISEITALLSDHRLVTLIGEGGAGKTRLSLQIGSRLADDFRGGVWFVELDSLRDPDLVAERFASTVGVEERADRTYDEVLVDHLRDHRSLLIVDNCEHVLPGAARVIAALLSGAAGARILATSRQRVGVAGEVAYRVPSLAVPDEGVSPDQARDYESVRLFLDRANLARPGFSMTVDNGAAIVRIVRHLDGIPLALELAAAKVGSLTPEQIADHLDDRFRLLSQGPNADRPRHQTLGAAIEWSFDLLTDVERQMFARLSVFRGGFDLTAAERVCALDESSEPVVVTVSALVDKSLLVADVDLGRYRLLETMRQFAGERLDLEGTREEIDERHARYFVEFAERAGAGLDGREQAHWLARLEMERDNLRAALEWSLAHEPMALRLASAIWRFWLLRGRPAEGRDWLGRVLGRRWEGDEVWRVNALLGMGGLASRQGDQDAARTSLDEALALASDIGDQRAASLALAATALILHKEGDLRGATTLFSEALDRAAAADDTLQRARVMTNLALVLADRGSHEEAGRTAREALALSRGTGIPDVIADATLTTAEIAITNGDTDEARALLEEALRQSTAAGVNDITAWARSYLGKLSLMSGDYKASRAMFGEAIEAFRDIESPMGTEWALRHMAVAELRSDELGAAIDTVREALQLASEFVMPDVPHVLRVVGEIAIARGDLDGATEIIAAARHTGAEMELGLAPTEAGELDAAWHAATSQLPSADVDAIVRRVEALEIDDVVALALDHLAR